MKYTLFEIGSRLIRLRKANSALCPYQVSNESKISPDQASLFVYETHIVNTMNNTRN